ncbi:hypothetical protein RJ639_031833 [Escallonia herrerae]|uniref:Pentatricopeptide repeat-containing protein n=1 Tax=Escallonia herrerae TaxID=1293975 RepID=A0AA88X1R8_9ASTE|nr:hypothetical protein RJ639_031833 [Escallonia herrerae]
MFSILQRSNSNPNSLLRKGVSFISTYYLGKNPKNDLFPRLSSIRDPNTNVGQVLDQWIEEGKRVREPEVQRIVRELRSRKLFSHALQVLEWTKIKGLFPFSSGDCAVQLNLIGVVRGLNAAETYFDNLSDEEKDEKTYGALLSCYVREGLIDKSISHWKKMKDIGCVSSPLPYNNIMCLYAQSSQLEKVPDVLSEMKKDGIHPNNFSYKICMNSYGERSDTNSMEKIVKELESRPHISIEWTIYSLLANCYIKAGLKEKALVALRKLEKKLHKDALGYNHLISLYGHLGNKDEVLRLWGVHKAVCKKQLNRDYITILGTLVKLGELDEAETVLKDWELSCHTFDFRVPNVLLIGYCQNGLIEKAEAMLQKIIKTGKTPIPNSWALIALAYSDMGKMEKAIVCMEEALALKAQNSGWKPKSRLLSSLLNWLGEKGEVEEVEAFVSSLKMVVPVNREIYHALLKASIRRGMEVSEILESMKSDQIDEDEDTLKILSYKT